MKRVLATGFGRFPGAPANPSQGLMAALGLARRPALNGIEIVTAVLPVTWAGALPALRGLIERHEPDAIVMFGLAGRSRTIRIETRAVNLGDGLRPDAFGQVHAGRALDSGEPFARMSRGSMQRLRQAIAAVGAGVALSRDAGTYLCNAALWTALGAAPAGLPVVFIHVPPLARRMPKARLQRRRLTRSQLLGAALATIRVMGARQGLTTSDDQIQD
jgi:pyroglutamyl-peptidase